MDCRPASTEGQDRVTDDVDQESSDEERPAGDAAAAASGQDDENPWRRARTSPSRDRLISWGSPPDDSAQPPEEQTPKEQASKEKKPEDKTPEEKEEEAPEPPQPAVPLATAPPVVPSTPRPRNQPPPPSGRSPGTFEPLAPPVVVTPPAPSVAPSPPPRTWGSPTIAATPADGGSVDRPERSSPAASSGTPRMGRPRTVEPTSHDTSASAAGDVGDVSGPPDEQRRGAAPPPPPPASTTSSTAITAKPVAPARPASITELSQQLVAIQQQLGELAGRLPAGADADGGTPIGRSDAGLRQVAKQLAAMQGQLTAFGDARGRGPAEISAERRATERTGAAVTELSQQLAAMQAQVASLSAQLTTLAHRITYDLERGAQTTTERMVRDLPAAVSAVLAAQLGPAIDDLTDEVEAGRTRLEAEIGTRLTDVGEAVEGLPLATVELLTSIQSLERDQEDRLARLGNRLTDQVATFERSNAAEMVRVREHVADLHDMLASPIADAETIGRMAGQVERLAQRASGTGEVVDALELLIAEHLEVLRDDIEARVAALGPMVQEELEAVRAEAVAGVGATEDVLSERIEALEATITARIDAALADQVDHLDALVAERLSQALAEATESTDRGVGTEVGAALTEVKEELQSLRRRISLRLEGDDTPAGLTAGQLHELAELVAAAVRGSREVPVARVAPPRPGSPRAARAAKKAPR
jgi:hypothetical protein